MTIASEIQRVQTNIANAYTSLEAKGATMPDTRNSANLASTIDSVPLTGDNTVQAFALGDAKNAVEGDKVLLNYSADMLTRDETVNVAGSHPDAQYFTPVRGGVFNRYSSQTSYFYKKDIDAGWVLSSSSGGTVNLPLFAIGRKGFVTTGMSGSRPFHVNEQGVITALGVYDTSHSRVWNWSCSDDDNLIIQPATNYGDAPMTVYKYENDSYAVRTVSRKTSGYDMYILPGGDGRYYPVVDESTNDIWKYDSATGEFVEKIGTGNGGYTGVSYKRFRITLDGGSTSSGSEGCSVSVHNLSWDGTTWTTSTDSELTAQLRSVLSGVSNTFVFIQKWKDELVFYSYVNNSTFKSIRIRYNEEKGMFEEPASVFVDKVSPYSVNYGDGDAALYVPTASQFILRKVGTPIEESYVAVQPNVRDQISPTTTLTGFVKENNNGVLAVSTVVDPNAVVPTPPDEYGLNATVNYGGDIYKEPNGEIKGSVSTAADGTATVSTQSGANGVEADNPLLNRDYSSFEIVVPFKTTSSSTQHLINFGTETLMVYYSGSTARLRVRTASDSSYVDTNASGTSLSSKKWLKLSYNTTEGYKLSYSTNGSSWTVAATNSRTGKPSALLNVLAFTNFIGDIYFADAYMVVDGVRVWEGTKSQINFGSVNISYGYFRNTLSNPSDKYIEYTGGILDRDDILDFEAYTLTPAVYRNADLGNWTSETEASLFGIGSQIPGTFKKLEPSVYLWHDYSHITSVKPETLKPVVKIGVGELSINGTVVGSLTTSSTGVISGFNASSYFTLPNLFKPGSSPWERIICFTTGSDVTTVQEIDFASPYPGGANSGILLQVGETTPKLHVGYSANGVGYDTILHGTTIIQSNTTYYTKMEFTGTAYNLYLSTTGAFAGEETLECSYTSSIPIYQSGTHDVFGYRTSSILQPFLGSIDLSKSYVKINGNVWWEGFIYDSGTVSLPVSWKHIDNILYEYPDGFPTTQALDLSVNIVEGSNNLYVTKTGDSCGLAISSTSPADVDSSAVIGTVELDTHGVIMSYTPLVSYSIEVNGLDLSDYLEETTIEYAEELYKITKMPIAAFGDLFTVGTRYRVELIEPEGYSIVFCRPDTLQWGTPATYYRHEEDIEYVLIALVDESGGQRFLPFSGKLTIGVGGGLLG